LEPRYDLSPLATDKDGAMAKKAEERHRFFVVILCTPVSMT